MASTIRKCRFSKCKHESNEINIQNEKYIKVGNQFFHEDCYEIKQKTTAKTAKQKADFQFIKNLWTENISNTVVYSQLFKVLNDFLERGVESEYLVFVVNYCINNKLKLNYPAGLRYFVDKNEIKNAYKKKQISEKIKKNIEEMKKEDNITKKAEPNEVTFTFKTKRNKGFGEIFEK